MTPPKTFEVIQSIQPNKEPSARQFLSPGRSSRTPSISPITTSLIFGSSRVYVFLIKGLHHFGVPYPKSGWSLFSAASNLLLALLLWFWMSPYLWRSVPVCDLQLDHAFAEPSGAVAVGHTLMHWQRASGRARSISLILERKQYFFWGSAVPRSGCVGTDWTLWFSPAS